MLYEVITGVIFYETNDYYYALTNNHVAEKYRYKMNQTIIVTDYYDREYKAYVYQDSLYA